MENILSNPSLLVLFGLIAPFLISVLKNPAWPNWVKMALTYLVVGAFGFGDVALRENLGDVHWSLNVIVAHVAVVATVAHGLYQLILKDTPLNDTLEAVGTPSPLPSGRPDGGNTEG